MLVHVILVSKLCSELIAVHSINLDEMNLLMPFKDFQDIIYDIYGLRNEYSIFWRYSPELFFQIADYITFTTALLFGAEGRIYVLMKDYDEPWNDNLTQMKVIDYVEEKAQKRAQYDPYEVKIIRDGEKDSEMLDAEMLESIVDEHEPSRSDADVIAYATSKLTAAPFFTADFSPQASLISALKQGK